jgi:prepilin-type N-terminal cleavage/methylation domain-containing protein
MSSRRGFTLLELVVSIAIAGIIALLVYGSASAGFDTRDALARHQAGAESELRVRVVLSDALRHASDEADPGTTAFDLVDALDPRGLPADQLTFLTRGMLPPLGASALWRVTVSPTSAGVVVRAEPVDGSRSAGRRDGDAPTFTSVLPNVRGLDIEVASLVDRAWLAAWPSSGQLPAAVRISLYDATGQLVGAPLVVRLGLEAVR